MERLCQAAHTVAAPATPDLQTLRWEGWPELLWQIQWPLDGAAEQIHADEAGRELAQASWKHVRGFAQGQPDETPLRR